MTNQARPDTRSGTLWAWVPVTLLGSMFIGLGSIAYVAIDDPGFALEPNYYDKAVHWDQAQAEARASHALGLQLSLAPLVLQPDGKVTLELTVGDRANLPLASAEVRIEAFPNAFASHVEQVVLKETRPGVYAGTLNHGLTGLWELRLSVKQSGQLYREALRRDVTKVGA